LKTADAADARKELMNEIAARAGYLYAFSPGPDWQQSARRLVDILITCSRQIK